MKPHSHSVEARNRFIQQDGKPVFLADWVSMVFLHFQIAPERLQPSIPFPLDLWEGKAWLSLVYFDQKGFHLRPFPWTRKWMGHAFANHGFLNVRTYVDVNGEKGIYFLKEWVSSSVAGWFAPRWYGFPYTRGLFKNRIDIQNSHSVRLGEVHESEGRFRFQVSTRLDEPSVEADPGSLDEFLVERYTAFTTRNGTRRRFRIWHEPWKLQKTTVNLIETDLLQKIWPFFERSTLAGATVSNGVQKVWIGLPARFK